MAKLLYKPFAIIASLIASRTGKSLFRVIWSKLDDADPPAPEVADVPLGKVLAARSLEAATMAAVAAATQRASMRTFHHLTGLWPGKTAEVLIED
jgi:hypothetical protein